jgi:membrane protein DedA with SNARE-associated domain
MRLITWVLHVLAWSGYGGIAIMMFVADLVFVVPSEVITPLAGFVAAREGLSFWLAVLAGTAGSVLGGVPWYYAGRSLRQHGLDRWLTEPRRILGIPTSGIASAQRWFTRHGGVAVLTARMLPGVRPLIGVPAGAAEMPLAAFLLYSTAGTAVWTTALMWGGWILREEFHRAGDAATVISIVIATTVATGYGMWVLIRRRREQIDPAGEIPTISETVIHTPADTPKPATRVQGAPGILTP